MAHAFGFGSSTAGKSLQDEFTAARDAVNLTKSDAKQRETALAKVRQRFAGVAIEDAVILSRAAAAAGATVSALTMSMDVLESSLEDSSPSLHLLSKGIAGGIKAKDAHDSRGVFLKLAVDHKAVYGTAYMATKAAKHEVSALAYFLSQDATAISGPLATCVDVMVPGSGALRVQAFTLLPQTTLCMGSEDAGKTVNIEPSLVVPMVDIADAFWIAPTMLRPRHGVVVHQFGRTYKSLRTELPLIMEPGIDSETAPPLAISSAASATSSMVPTLGNISRTSTATGAGDTLGIALTAVESESQRASRMQQTANDAQGVQDRTAPLTADAAASHGFASDYDTVDEAGAASAAAAGARLASAIPLIDASMAASDGTDSSVGGDGYDQVDHHANTGSSLGTVASTTAPARGVDGDGYDFIIEFSEQRRTTTLAPGVPTAKGASMRATTPSKPSRAAAAGGVAGSTLAMTPDESQHDYDEAIAGPPESEGASRLTKSAASRASSPAPTRSTLASTPSSPGAPPGLSCSRVPSAMSLTAAGNFLQAVSSQPTTVAGRLGSDSSAPPPLSAARTAIGEEGTAGRDGTSLVARSAAPTLEGALPSAPGHAALGDQPSEASVEFLPSNQREHPILGGEDVTLGGWFALAAATSRDAQPMPADVCLDSCRLQQPLHSAKTFTPVVSPAPGIAMPLPFDVEGHVASTGERFLLDAHRLLLPDVPAIVQVRSNPSMLVLALVQQDDRAAAATSASRWRLVIVGTAAVPPEDVALLKTGPPRGTSAFQAREHWLQQWEQVMQQAAISGVNSSDDPDLSSLAGATVEPHAVRPDAGLAVFACTAPGADAPCDGDDPRSGSGTARRRVGCLVVACPGLFWGRMPTLTMLFPPSAGAVLKRLGAPRVCPDVVFQAYKGSSEQRARLRADADAAAHALVGPGNMQAAVAACLASVRALELGRRGGGGGLFSRESGWNRDVQRRAAAKAALHEHGIGLRYSGLAWLHALAGTSLQEAATASGATDTVAAERVFAAACLPSVGSVAASALADAAASVAAACGMPCICQVGGVASTAVGPLAAAAIARAFGSKQGYLPVDALRRALTASACSRVDHLPAAELAAHSVTAWEPLVPPPRSLASGLDGQPDQPLATAWARAQFLAAPVHGAEPVSTVKGSIGGESVASAMSGRRAAVLEAQAVRVDDMDEAVHEAQQAQAAMFAAIQAGQGAGGYFAHGALQHAADAAVAAVPVPGAAIPDDEEGVEELVGAEAGGEDAGVGDEAAAAAEGGQAAVAAHVAGPAVTIANRFFREVTGAADALEPPQPEGVDVVGVEALARLQSELKHRQGHAVQLAAGELPLLVGIAALSARDAGSSEVARGALLRALALTTASCVDDLLEHDPHSAHALAGAKAAAALSVLASRRRMGSAVSAALVAAGIRAPRAGPRRSRRRGGDSGAATLKELRPLHTLVPAGGLTPAEQAATDHAALACVAAHLGGREQAARAVVGCLQELGEWAIGASYVSGATAWLLQCHQLAETLCPGMGTSHTALRTGVLLAQTLATQGSILPAIAASAHTVLCCAAARGRLAVLNRASAASPAGGPPLAEQEGAASGVGAAEAAARCKQPSRMRALLHMYAAAMEVEELPSLQVAITLMEPVPETELVTVVREMVDTVPDEGWQCALLQSCGKALTRGGKAADALLPFQQALELAERIGDSARELPDALQSVASALSAAGDLRASSRLLLRCCKLLQRQVGEGHEGFARALSQLGSVYTERADHTRALRLHVRAARIFRARLGDESVAYASSLSELSSAFLSLGKSREALRLLEMAREVQRRSLARAHPQRLLTELRMGEAHALRRNNPKASVHFGEVLSAVFEAEAARGMLDHGMLVGALMGMGLIMSKAGQLDQAKVSLDAADSYIAAMAIRPPHPTLAKAKAARGVWWLRQDEYEQAAECFERSVEMLLATSGDGTVALASTLMDLAKARAKLGRWADAVRAAYDSGIIRRRRLGRYHGATRGTFSFLEDLRDFVGGTLPGDVVGEAAEDWVAGPPVPGSKAEEIANALAASIATAEGTFTASAAEMRDHDDFE